MISVGSRDGRKGLGLGFGGGGNSSRRRDMDDTELEEGEAYLYHNNSNCDDDDASFDPDVDLSYLDEKLQGVLGHFQKDFEGGVSAEKLGAAFGGYGSFLPTYQRSPASSQRTPTKFQSISISRSPNNLLQEAGNSNSVVSSTAPQSGGRGPASTSSTSFTAVKSLNEGKKVIVLPESRVGDLAPGINPKNKKHSNALNQKTLKVRIKMGPGNLSARKNAAIYSGLGLDDSPSSSMDDSPSESEGISHERQDVPFQSPTSILQIMTSFPVRGGLPLSPLPDDLINLLDKPKLPKEGRCIPSPRGGMESASLINGSASMKSDGKNLGEKNMKSVEKNDHSMESKSGRDKDARARDFSRKETDLDASACDELVSNTLKLPILSNPYSSDSKRSKESRKGVMKDNVSSFRGENKEIETMFTQEDGWVDKRRASAVGVIQVEGENNFTANEVGASSNREGQQRGEKIYDIVKPNSNASKAKNSLLITEGMDTSRQKSNKKTASYEQESTRVPLEKEYPVPGEKKKSKGSHSILATGIPKESLKVCSSMVKTNKSTAEISMNTGEAESGKSYKDRGRIRETYTEFFGDMEEEHTLVEAPTHRLKESDVLGKSRSAINNVAKERPGAEKSDNLSMPATVPLRATSPRLENGHLPDLAHPTQPPGAKDLWVCCDKCQKWRLLPVGTSDEGLPEKWVCIMLDWLPGMNQCSFTEEETNNAVVAMNQALLAPESQLNLHNNPGGSFAGPSVSNFSHPDQNLRNLIGKKKFGVKVMSNAVKDSSAQSSKAMKKNAQTSSKSRSLNDVNNFPLLNEPDLQQLGRSNDFVSGEDQKQKYREKNKGLEPHAFPGDSKNSNSKSRRDSDHDSSRASKKIRSESKNITDEGWASDHSGAVGKIGPSTSGVFPTSSAGKDRPKYSDRSFSKDSKPDVNDMLQGSLPKRRVKDEFSFDNGSLDMGNTEARDGSRKRKSKEVQNGSYLNSGGNLPNNSPFVKEEFSDNDYRKEKKPRVSRSDGKESSASKGHSRADKKRSHSKKNLHGLDSSKKDLGSRQPSLAATSSSSKVSGSHKTRSSFQEMKGSPVESVSSSPMRISNLDKFTSGGRDGTMKEESQHAGDTPSRRFDGSDMGGTKQPRGGRSENTPNMTHRGSVEYPPQEHPHLSNSKGKLHIAPSPNATNHHPRSSALNIAGQDGRYPGRPSALDHFADEEKQSEYHLDTNGSHPRKSAKGSSSKSDKSRSLKSDSDVVRTKSSDARELHDRVPSSSEVKTKDGKKKLPVKLGVKSDETEEKDFGTRLVSGKQMSETSKGESRRNGKLHDGADIKADIMSTPKQSMLLESNDERSSKRLGSDKTEQVETVSSWDRPALLPPSAGPQNGVTNRPLKGIGPEISQIDAHNADNAQKLQKQIRKSDNQKSQSQTTSSKNPTKNGQKASDIEVPSPIRRDIPSHTATNALREAKDLKHMADRLKSAGSSYEGTGLYFQAALKFLHGASLLETGCSDGPNHNDLIRSRQTYGDTAKLCEFCAHEYEKSKDLAAAALAYKCTEVAYMRAVYSSNASASRDRHELQTAFQLLPPGESPSSSASDVDNLNNHTITDKAALSKGVGSPQVAANHVIAARNRPNYVRLLHFAQDVNFAMEASRKSWVAYSSAYGNKPEAKHGEPISSVKRVLEFGFQNIDGLLPLVRVAMEAIGR